MRAQAKNTSQESWSEGTDWILAVCESSTATLPGGLAFWVWLSCVHQRAFFLSKLDPYEPVDDGTAEQDSVLGCQQKWDFTRFEPGTEQQLTFARELCINTTLSHSFSAQPLMQWEDFPSLYYARAQEATVVPQQRSVTVREGQPAADIESTRPGPRPILLVHIQKTGGQSVAETLGIKVQDGWEPYLGNGTQECAGIPVMSLRHDKHDSAQAARSFYTSVEWDHAYKITFVRNPWSRMVSFWAMLMSYSANPPSDILEEVAYLKANILQPCGCMASNTSAKGLQPEGAEYFIDEPTLTCDLAYFVKNCVPAAYLTSLNFIQDADGQLEASMKLDAEHIMLDFVGRTENLQAHLEQALVAAGNDAASSAACAASLIDNDHGITHSSYETYFEPAIDHAYYTAADILSPTFQSDANAFGYDFNATDPTAVVFQRAAAQASQEAADAHDDTCTISDFLPFEEHMTVEVEFVRQDAAGDMSELWTNVTARLKDMTDNGVSRMAISPNTPGLQTMLEGFERTPANMRTTMRKLNMGILKKVNESDGRMRGLCSLFMSDQALAIAELQWCKQAGFVGVLLNGAERIVRTAAGRNETSYDYYYKSISFFEECVRLKMFVYLHPQCLPYPPTGLYDASDHANPKGETDHVTAYSFNNSDIQWESFHCDAAFDTGAAWGYSVHTADIAVHLVLSRLFEKVPDLKLVLGHQGEHLAYQLWRIDSLIHNPITGPNAATAVNFTETFRHNFYVTTSGFFDTAGLMHLLAVMPQDHILFSADSPFE